MIYLVIDLPGPGIRLRVAEFLKENKLIDFELNY
jgi:hypothetical protein